MILTYIPQLKLGHKPPCGIHCDALGPIYKHQKFFQPQIFAMHANTWYFYYSFPSTCKFYNRELNNTITQVTNLKKTSYFAQLLPFLTLHQGELFMLDFAFCLWLILSHLISRIIQLHNSLSQSMLVTKRKKSYKQFLLSIILAKVSNKHIIDIWSENNGN